MTLLTALSFSRILQLLPAPVPPLRAWDPLTLTLFWLSGAGTGAIAATIYLWWAVVTGRRTIRPRGAR